MEAGLSPSSCGGGEHRGTSLARKQPPLGPYRRPMPGVLGGSWEVARFLMGMVSPYDGGLTYGRGVMCGRLWAKLCRGDL